jgi:hypothetical protein
VRPLDPRQAPSCPLRSSRSYATAFLRRLSLLLVETFRAIGLYAFERDPLRSDSWKLSRATRLLFHRHSWEPQALEVLEFLPTCCLACRALSADVWGCGINDWLSRLSRNVPIVVLALQTHKL